MIKEKEITAMSDEMFKNIMKTESGLFNERDNRRSAK